MRIWGSRFDFSLLWFSAARVSAREPCSEGKFRDVSQRCLVSVHCGLCHVRRHCRYELGVSGQGEIILEQT